MICSFYSFEYLLDGQVLITTGLVEGGHEGEYSRQSEVLDLKNGNSYCSNWAQYRHDTEGSFGAFVDGDVIVCIVFVTLS